MSVDYQASGPGHGPPASPGPRLNFSEDSRVILGDSAMDAFAYVHHVTLYDLQARGMVRPFCMAYVCSDQAKLMENFSELSTCFSQAAESLKTGNRQAFSMELQRKLQELEISQQSLLKQREGAGPADQLPEVREREDELRAVQRSISNHRDLLRQVTSYPNRKLKQPDFLPYDPADSLCDTSMLLLPPEPERLPSSLACSRTEQRLKPLQELCNTYFLSLTKEQLASSERRLRGDRSLLRTTRITHSLSRTLTLLNFLFELWSPEDCEEEEERGQEEEPRAPAASCQSGDQPLSLESAGSCVEEITIKLEAGGAGAAWGAGGAGSVSPDLCAATEMTGSTSSSDSIEVLGTERSYQAQREEAGPDSTDGWRCSPRSVSSPPGPPSEPLAGIVHPPCRQPTAEVGVRRGRAYARRANSEDSIEVLSTTDSIFPDDLTAITEEAEQQLLSSSLEQEEEEEMLTDRKMFSAAGHDQQEQGCGDRAEELHRVTEHTEAVIKEEQVCEGLESSFIQEDQAERTHSPLHVEEAVESPPVCQWIQPVPDVCQATATQLDPACSPPCPPLRLPSMDEASDSTSITGSSAPPSPKSIQSSSSCWQRKRRRKAALRALRFIRHNSFSQHAVFCLLSGRTLVVVGADQAVLRQQVEALSLFLPAPGPMGAAVMPCLSTPLQLTDLLTWRLIGVHRAPSSSSASILRSLSRYSRYMALLDLEQRTLHCPSYSGSLLRRLADPHSSISRGLTYLLHLESGLTALASQALLYTFTGHNQDSLSSPGACSSQADVRVMEFLSDLIKQRHAGRGPPSFRFSYCSVQLHRNTHTA